MEENVFYCRCAIPACETAATGSFFDANGTLPYYYLEIFGNESQSAGKSCRTPTVSSNDFRPLKSFSAGEDVCEKFLEDFRKNPSTEAQFCTNDDLVGYT